MRCLQQVRYRLQGTVEFSSTQKAMSHMIWQNSQVHIQFCQVMRTILEIRPRTGQLHISTQLTNIPRTLIDQQSTKSLGHHMDIRPNPATLGRKKGTQQFIAPHHRALMQAGQVNRHRDTPVERRQQGGIRVFSRCGQQEKRGLSFLDIAQTPEMLAVHQVKQHLLAFGWQEMLFYLMDREHFRRLGDVKERQSSLLLLAATTENPDTALLPTFHRRIPMTITLPGLHERTMMERYELLRAFFTTERSGIGANIHVAPQVLCALLLYECPGNIGQLRTDVQLACARAYLEYRTHNLAELNVHLGVLPDHVRHGLLRTSELNRALEPVAHLLEATHIFTPTGLSLGNLPESAQDLYG